MAQKWRDLGKLIRENRLKQNMTQADLAEKVYKKSSEICRWERGDRRPKQASLLELSMIFGIPIQVLQQKAGYTPEFDWLSSFLVEKESEEDILLSASELEKGELREHLRYIRFRARLLKTNRPHSV